MVIPALMLSVVLGVLTKIYPIEIPEVPKEPVVEIVLDDPQSHRYKIGEINWKRVKR